MAVAPLREPTFFVLAALARGASHGYRLLGEIEELSEGRVRLRTGTLYAALDRLRRDGLVEQLEPEPGDGPPRRPFALTPSGRQVLADEVERLSANAAVGRLGLDAIS